MKHIKEYEEFVNENLLKGFWNLLKGAGEFSINFIKAAAREGKETIEFFKILAKMVQEEEKVSDDEKKFVKEQSKDILKIFPWVTFAAVPTPMPLLPLLYLMGQKYDYNILPKSHEKMSLAQLKQAQNKLPKKQIK